MSLVHEPLEREAESLDFETALRDLNRAASQLDKASEELSRLTTRFEGTTDPDTGEITVGLRDRYEFALEGELLKICDPYLEAGKRPPAEDIRTARAKRHLRVKEEQLCSDYLSTLGRIHGLKIWISSRKEIISARQSVLNGLRAAGA